MNSMAYTTSASLFFMRDPIRRPPSPPPCSKYHSLMQQTFPTPRIPLLLFPSIRNKCYINKTSTMLSNKASKFRVKCLRNEEYRNGSNSVFVARRGGRVIVDELLKMFFNALKKPIIAGIMLGALLLSSEALAASGGRMGGRSSRSSSRSYSSSRCRRSLVKSNVEEEPQQLSAFDVGILVFATVSLSCCLLMLIVVIPVLEYFEERDSEKTLFMLQIGLLGMATKSLQRELNWIAETANTSTSEGLNRVLKGTTYALLSHHNCCISCYSSVDVQKGKAVEICFKKLSMEERRKFDAETLVNVNNIKKKSTIARKSNGFGKEYMVVTILVVAKGVQKFHVINSRKDLKEALEKLGSICSIDRKEIEVLWTPQQENDTLSESEYLEDYPRLRPL